MPQFKYSLNTATIRPTPLMEQIKIAGAVGFQGIELWISDVFKHLKEGGGKLADIRKALDDNKLERPSMIALWGYCEPDSAKYEAAVTQMKKTLEAAAVLGVQRIVVSPPPGEVDLKFAAKRYAEVLELSESFGVDPSVEFLGFVKGIYKTEHAWKIAAPSGDSRASITPDIFHISRGGGKLEELDNVPTDHISIFHWNDVPAKPERSVQTDADRVLPGDGTYDLKGVAAYLKKKGYEGYLSLELFNRELWAKDPKEVCKSGLEKMKATSEV